MFKDRKRRKMPGSWITDFRRIKEITQIVSCFAENPNAVII
jgi:hypothetical protein